jgi:hypothetical protein
VCLFYQHDVIQEVQQTFAHHEEALRWVVLSRVGLPSMFGAIIYKRKKYLNYFLTNSGWKVFEFMDRIRWCIIAIEGMPPLISYADDFKQNEKDLIFEDKLGFQFPRMKLVLVYTGGLGKQGIFAYILHETGHTVFDYKTKLSYESYTLRHELAAWEFVKDNASKVGLTPTYVACLAKDCLDTYLEDGMRGTGMPKKIWTKRYNSLIKEATELKIE